MTFKKGQVAWNKGKKGLQVAWNKGKSPSEETRRKISEANKGKDHWTGRHHTSETKEKLKKRPQHFHKGMTPWNKGLKGVMPTPWMKGKHHTPESILKISQAHKGKHPSEETIRKRVLLITGQTRSDKTKKRMSLAQKGKHFSEETRRKISESVREVMSNPELKRRLSEIKKEQFASGEIKSWNKGKKLGKNPEHSERMKGRVPPNKGVPMREDVRNRMIESVKKRMANPEIRKIVSDRTREQILRQYESGAFPQQTNTKPERQIKDELIKRGYKEGIDFIHQYKFMNKFMCDFCFLKQKVIIEVYGDFWHANPKKYPVGSTLHKHQIKDMGKDKSKEAYITKVDNNSWTYLVLWERDIKEDAVKCVDRIEEVLTEKKIKTKI